MRSHGYNLKRRQAKTYRRYLPLGPHIIIGVGMYRGYVDGKTFLAFVNDILDGRRDVTWNPAIKRSLSRFKTPRSVLKNEAIAEYFNNFELYWDRGKELFRTSFSNKSVFKEKIEVNVGLIDDALYHGIKTRYAFLIFLCVFLIKTWLSRFSLFFSGVYLTNKPVKNNSVLKSDGGFWI